MSLEPILDFPWVHVEARSHDNFRPASYQVDKPFLVHNPKVARQKVSLLVERPGRLDGLPMIAPHHPGAPDGYLPHALKRKLRTVRPKHADGGAVERTA